MGYTASVTRTYPEQGVDLTSCDVEPIHHIGAVQSFGYLIALSPDLIIVRASANCEEILGRPVADCIGYKLDEFVTASSLARLGDQMQIIPEGGVERLFSLPLTDNGDCFDVALYHSGRSVVMELERAWVGRSRDYLSLVRPMLNAVRSAGELEDICQMAARQMRHLTGFDRVKVYRFDETGAGEVIAEARKLGIESFMGMHFPASDIPKQARRLYTQNLLRIIADVDDEVVPIIPQRSITGELLDLSHSGIRAVSPIHLEYLRNMGIKASMSVSILRNGQLWGLFACHNYSPRRLDYVTRSAAELFGEFFSSMLEQTDAKRRLEVRQTISGLHDRLMVQAAQGRGLMDAFDTFADLIGQVIPFDGIVAYIGGVYTARGHVPNDEQFRKLALFLNTAGNSVCWSTYHLAALYPPAEEFAQHACGLLAVPVSRMPRDYIVLFRREFAQNVPWAGNPDAPKHAAGPLGDRLTPRKSFALWQEERRGHAKPWSEDEREIAEGLRTALLEIILQLADITAQEKAQAAQHQQDLTAELNHRVRNMLTMIGAIVSDRRQLPTNLNGMLEPVRSRIATIAWAYDLVNEATWEPFPVFELIARQVQLLGGKGAHTLTVEGSHALVRPSALTTVALVIHELVYHSAALATGQGHVRVVLDRCDMGDMTLEWLEDSPEVMTMWADKQALAIVERAIPHELDGQAQVDFGQGRLHAHYRIPAERVEFAGFSLPASAPIAPPLAVQAPLSTLDGEMLLSGRLLVVEDNAIIGMETEDYLRDLGSQEVDLASSVSRALKLLDQHDYEMAVLDVNLGDETSQPIAQRLMDLGVPFTFTTGYGELRWGTDAFGTVPVVTKPIDPIALERAIVQARQAKKPTSAS